MISVYLLKPKFQNLLRPIANFLAKRGVSANLVTISACIVSIVYGLAGSRLYTSTEYWLLLPGLLFLRMALNAIDGMIAKEHNQVTKLGGALNELCDIASDAFLIWPFYFVIAENMFLIYFFALMATLTEVAGIYSQAISGVRSYTGPMGKSDRAFVLGTLGVLIGLWGLPSLYIASVLSVCCVLCGYTIKNRLKMRLEHLSIMHKIILWLELLAALSLTVLVLLCITPTSPIQAVIVFAAYPVFRLTLDFLLVSLAFINEEKIFEAIELLSNSKIQKSTPWSSRLIKTQKWVLFTMVSLTTLLTINLLQKV